MTDEAEPSKVYLDTNIFCAAFEGEGKSSEQLASVFDLLQERPRMAVTSEMTLAELLGAESPHLGWQQQNRVYLNLLVFRGLVDLVPVSRAILLETADYRRAARRMGRQIRLPDAIHAVTAVSANCQFIFTADNRFLVPKPLTRIALDATGIATLKGLLDA